MKNYLAASLAAILCLACTSSEPTIRGLWKGTIKADDGTPIPLMIDSSVLKSAGMSVSIPTQAGGLFTTKYISENMPLEGFYIQPSNQVGGQRLAHSVTLLPDQDDQWVGTATPLARDFSVFMNITEAKSKSLKAVMLNPQRNITGPARQYYLKGDELGDNFTLTLPDGETEFSKIEFDRLGKNLRMDFGPIEDFRFNAVKASSEEAQDFFGKTSRKGLSKPNPGGTWPTRAPNAAGFSNEKLLALVERLENVSGNEGQPELVHSLVIARGGTLVLEEYFRGHSKDEPHDIRSAGKTFASVLTGALIQDGYDLSADTPMNMFIDIPNQPADTPLKLGHLLTHQSGLDCYDGDNASPGNEDKMWQQSETENLWAFTAKLDFKSPPGSIHAYCSGGINLAGAALAGATGQSVLSLLDTKIFKPLGFENAYWNVMPNGEAYLGGGAYLRTRDLMKIGQLYLDYGKWQGKQIIDSAWVNSSLSPKVEITPETTGLDERTFSRFYFGGTDGYAWHLHTITVGDETYDTYEASGNGGQMVIVVPALDIVVGMTGGNYMEGFVWGQWRQTIIGDGIIAALETP